MELAYMLLLTIPHINRKTFIIMGMLMVLILFISAKLVGYYSGQFLPSYNARITSFFTCTGPPATATIAVQPMSHFATTSPVIYACGLLEGTTFRRFASYWYRDNVNIYSTLDQRFDLGSFYILLPINPHHPNYYPGNYRVDIYVGRDKVASTEFTVK